MSTFRNLAFAVSIFSVALTTACGSSDSGTSSSSVSAIAVSPNPCAVGKSDSIQMSALATLPDGTKQDITSSASWNTANSQTATVDSKGNVVGVNAGVTSISAEYQGATGKVDCTVGP